MVCSSRKYLINVRAIRFINFMFLIKTWPGDFMFMKIVKKYIAIDVTDYSFSPVEELPLLWA